MFHAWGMWLRVGALKKRLNSRQKVTFGRGEVPLYPNLETTHEPGNSPLQFNLGLPSNHFSSWSFFGVQVERRWGGREAWARSRKTARPGARLHRCGSEPRKAPRSQVCATGRGPKFRKRYPFRGQIGFGRKESWTSSWNTKEAEEKWRTWQNRANPGMQPLNLSLGMNFGLLPPPVGWNLKGNSRKAVAGTHSSERPVFSRAPEKIPFANI